MFSHRSMHKTAVLLLLAGAVSAPSLAFADRDHGKRGRERNERSDRDSRHGDRDGHGDRRGHDRHDREVRWERPRHGRDCGPRAVRYVEVRRPAPRFAVAVQFGRPACPPPPVCYAPPAPVYVAPTHGAYYDPYCDARYASFEVYFAHFSRDHGITVAIRN